MKTFSAIEFGTGRKRGSRHARPLTIDAKQTGIGMMKRCRTSTSLGLALIVGVLGAVATAGEPGPAGGKPDRILFVGATRLTYLWEAALKDAGWNRIAFESGTTSTPDCFGSAGRW